MPGDTKHETDNLIEQVFAIEFPLVQGRVPCNPGLAAKLPSLKQAFKEAPNADGAVCGLLLRAGCWEAAHNIAQDINDKDGSYWHAIIHRMEPDIGNAGYWYRKVGEHAIHADLTQKVRGIEQHFPDANLHLSPWQETAYLKLYDKALQAPGGDVARAVQQVHEAEWQLLYEWCAGS